MTSEAKKGKHTPGPWEVDDYGTLRGPASVGSDGVDETGTVIAYFVDDILAWLNPHGEADATLAAAAPALLKALEIAFYCTVGGVRWCSYCGHDDDAQTKPMPHTSTCWVPLAEAAIAAARGQTDEARSEHEQLEGFLQDGAS